MDGMGGAARRIRCYDARMLPPAALGELLIVGAIPAAATLAIIGGILARRHRRLAYVLAALAGVVLVAMMVTGRRLTAPLNELRSVQKERFADLEVGWTREAVEASLGAADLRCPGEDFHEHRVMGTTELLSNLYASTTERWIYTVPGAQPTQERPGCRPLYGDGEVGFNAEGRVIWYIELTDETFMTF